MDNIKHDLDQDYFEAREQRILLYQSRATQDCDPFTGEPHTKRSKNPTKQELDWLKVIGLA